VVAVTANVRQADPLEVSPPPDAAIPFNARRAGKESFASTGLWKRCADQKSSHSADSLAL
jgi:hypothetical protein